MFMARSNAPVIALEEHYWDTECFGPITPADDAGSTEVAAHLAELAEMRLASMDAAGIDIQVLSHTGPGVQKLSAEKAANAAKGLNDRLAERVARHPQRFAGFAALPTIDPEAAANELTRAVKELSFKGAMIFGLTDGHFVDERRFWPIFAAAEELDVPIYLHPAMPHPAVIGAYYKDLEVHSPMLTRAAWGSRLRRRRKQCAWS
jgi:predicted TIM-barrel fold metal-dependent hydrolase